MYRNVANEMSRDRNDQDRKVPWPQRPDRKGQIASARPKWLRLKRPDRISQTETAKPIGRVPWGGGWSGWENGYKPLLYRFGTSLFECLAFSICSRGFLNTKNNLWSSKTNAKTMAIANSSLHTSWSCVEIACLQHTREARVSLSRLKTDCLWSR